jgi:hypothetical protein
VDVDVWPVFFKDGLGVGLAVTECDSAESVPLGSKGKSTDSAEEIEVRAFIHLLTSTVATLGNRIALNCASLAANTSITGSFPPLAFLLLTAVPVSTATHSRFPFMILIFDHSGMMSGSTAQ